MNPPPPHIVFAGGGTGGHLFPGLAVAERLVADDPQTRITFAGTGREFERRHVKAAGFDYLALRCRPWPERLRDALAFLLDNIAGYRAARRFLAEQGVRVVVGLGGYASAAMAKAAARRGLPLVLLEQNAVPGRATRWLAGSATLICTTFAQAHRHLHARCHVRVTGNPLRPGFGRLEGPKTPSHAGSGRTRQLLILGGSGGAQSLNENVPKALLQVRSRLAGWRIVHQSGPAQVEATRELYRLLRLRAQVGSFVTNMAATLRETDLAICRAGGTTLAELAAAGVPAILLPYRYAADDHQRRNADIFAAAGACVVLDEREVNGRLDYRLADTLLPLLMDRAERAAMSAAIRRLAHPDATWDVATLIRQLAGCPSIGSGSVASHLTEERVKQPVCRGLGQPSGIVLEGDGQTAGIGAHGKRRAGARPNGGQDVGGVQQEIPGDQSSALARQQAGGERFPHVR